jgi:hypothetical protein
MTAKLDDRDYATLLGAARVVLGGAALLAPRTAARAWFGPGALGRSTVAMRGLAARDIALGLGVLIALDEKAPVRGWLEAGALSDAGDAFATLVAAGDIPFGRWLLSLAASAGAMALGLRLASSLGRR